MLSPIIETERLILRRYKETDIEMQYEIMTDTRLHTYIKFPNISKEEELECIKEIILNADNDEFEKWVIEIKETNTPIGTISVKIINQLNNYCNVGYVIMYDYWGKGYTVEALKAVSDYLLNERNYYLVECACNELNTQSSNVMLKAGFKKDGHIENRRINSDGTYTALEFYSKMKE